MVPILFHGLVFIGSFARSRSLDRFIRAILQVDWFIHAILASCFLGSSFSCLQSLIHCREPILTIKQTSSLNLPSTRTNSIPPSTTPIPTPNLDSLSPAPLLGSSLSPPDSSATLLCRHLQTNHTSQQRPMEAKFVSIRAGKWTTPFSSLPFSSSFITFLRRFAVFGFLLDIRNQRRDLRINRTAAILCLLSEQKATKPPTKLLQDGSHRMGVFAVGFGCRERWLIWQAIWR
ncbi:hypothetical protein C8J56DRAFT_250291 [Mycena floridula]|nr:hypothetical protein C8J56DRAFT_250291 [Mycena floridula]